MWRNAGLERLEWSGCKAGESVIVRGRKRADNWRRRAGGRLGARQRQASSASVGSVKPQGTTEIVEAEMETFRQNHLPAAAGASLRVSSSVADICFRLTPRLKSFANLNGWNARRPFNYLRRSTRARGSERHAERDLRLSMVACRCPPADRVSGLRGHERQASAHAPNDIRKWKP